MKIELRDYQTELISEIKNKLKNSKRVLAVLPTGGGKTVIFSYIAKQAINQKKRVLILSHRREIVYQIRKSLYDFGMNGAVIESGSRNFNENMIQVGMIITISKRLKKIEKPDLIIVDEAHHVKAKTWSSVLAYWDDPLILGFTATPERLDGKGLYPEFEAMALGANIQSLIDNEYLSKLDYYRPPQEITFENLKTTGGDYSRSQQAEKYTSSIYGDVILHYEKHLNGLPTIAFCPTVESAQNCKEQFIDAGYTAECVHGQLKDKDRNNIIQGLGRGTYNVVTTCDVISEGVDVPIVCGAILLRKTKSLTIFLQQVGRVLRPYPGKTSAIVLDHVGNYREHGHPLKHRKWNLHGKPKKKSEREIIVTDCPECFAIMTGSPSVCENCGAKLKFAKVELDMRENILVVDVDLEKYLPEKSAFDKNQIKNTNKDIEDILGIADKSIRNKKIWKLAYRMSGVPGGFSVIQYIGNVMKYKQGWAIKTYESNIKYRKQISNKIKTDWRGNLS